MDEDEAEDGGLDESVINGIDDIRTLDNELVTYDQTLVAAFVTLNTGLLDALRDLLDRLALNGRATTALETRSNLQLVTMWRAGLPALLERLGLSSLVEAVASKITDVASRINRYFSLHQPGFNGADYGEWAVGMTTQMRQRLTESVVGSYGPLLDDTLSWGVLTRATKAELRSALVAKLPDDGPLPKQLGQVASDVLYTFSRGYTQTVAEGLNLRYHYYMGTEIATTRTFCHQRIGKAYTQAEVESWAMLVWSGQIPGTTSLTIFWYCGGFRCRHRLLPITQRVYNYLNNRNNKDQ